MNEKINDNQIIGLTSKEVEIRIAKGFSNVSLDNNSKTKKDIIKSNILTFFNLIMIIMAVLIIIVGSFKNLTFLVIAIANTLIGIFQELKAKKTLDELSLLSESKTLVLRDNNQKYVSTQNIVIDDIMILKSGNQISADAKVISGKIEVNESLLTGESDTIDKDINDPLYSGSFVVAGKCYAKVISVGNDSYANKIASVAKELKKSKSQLQKSINQILKIVSFLIIPLGIGLFITQHYVSKMSFSQSIIGTVAAILGMIPEGLVLLTSVSLAVGIINLGKRKTLVQDLFSIETLARVDMLCLDKTGTLTTGEMKVEKIDIITGDEVNMIMGNLLNALEDQNATALALEKHFKKYNNFDVISTIPFSSSRKYSGVKFNQGSYVLGAYEYIVKEDNYDLKEKIDFYTKEGFRVLALAKCDFNSNKEINGKTKVIALIIISDIIRKDAKETLMYFASQNVDLRIISGDNPLTVSIIAKKVGFPHSEAEKYLDATTLKTKSDVKKAVREYKIFGRVTPEIKKEIIIALKELGHTVAMTGDGVNDVLALKEADCSIAMAEGSDAAKKCSNVVLLDSNFSSLPYIVGEGRRVINNIKASASLFLVKTFFSFILAVLVLLFGTPYPFIPIHLSVISTVAVGIPTFILNLEPNFDLVEKGFLKSVLLNALTGAFTIIIQILFITYTVKIFGYNLDTRTTMCVIATGITSLYMIKRVFSLTSNLRKVVYYSMFSLFLFGMIFLQDLLTLADIEYIPTILLIIMILSSPILIENIQIGLKFIQKSYNKLTKKNSS